MMMKIQDLREWMMTNNNNYDNYLLSIVVPVYNEENGIKPFLDRTEAVSH